MRYRDLKIHTQREAPNNARTPGFAWLARAGYISREGRWMPLGERSIGRLRNLTDPISFLKEVGISLLESEGGYFLSIQTGQQRVIHCPACGYTDHRELAKSNKSPFSSEDPLPLEKVFTPGCHTIEALADYLNLPHEKTAKALMFTRTSDDRFVFVVIRGDQVLSEAKLRNLVGDYRLATPREIESAGAEPGFASPLGLRDALIVVDDLIPRSPNLVAGANLDEYHMLNTNCGRDYTPEITADLTMAHAGDPCMECGNPLTEQSAMSLMENSTAHYENMLFALAETHHDERGLTLPTPAAAFDIYLMHLAGREMDTRSEAERIYEALSQEGISVLFDDREERAGVKFNDADLIGCPMRVTLGEKNLQKGMVELKPRKEKESRLIPLGSLIEELKSQN